mgnify:CR=1 FL=1
MKHLPVTLFLISAVGATLKLTDNLDAPWGLIVAPALLPAAWYTLVLLFTVAVIVSVFLFGFLLILWDLVVELFTPSRR